MLEIKGKTIIYTTPETNQLGPVSPYLFSERLTEKILEVFPRLKVSKVFASKKQYSHQIYCVLPSDYTDEQVRLIKAQIELMAANVLADLQEKIYFAQIVSD